MKFVTRLFPSILVTVQCKILHIFDDAIISQSTINLFKKIEGFEQTFAAIIPSSIKKLGSINNEHSVIQLKNSGTLVNEIAALIEEHDIIIFQALSFEKAKSMLRKRFKTKVFIWGLWGYELYNVVNYFKPNSENAYSTEVRRESTIKQRIRDFYTYNWVYARAIRKIDICLFLLESDFKLLTQAVKTKANWYTSCYQTIENLFGNSAPFDVRGNAILIGNSSTPSNRHPYLFKKLKELDLSERKLLVPLSYGDLTYQKTVISEGEKLFDNSFSPITTFMNLDDYIDHLKECSHAIFGHKRQQAFGNILMMLYAGSKIYLSKENPLYAWFKSRNIHIYSIEEELNNVDFSYFPENLKNENKELINALISEKIILNQLNNLLTQARLLSEQKLK